MTKKELPIIFVLDMDQCIIGNSEYILNYRILINNYILENCKNKKINSEICKISKDLWKQYEYLYYIRPYFKEFILNIKKLFKNVEFFIFSFGIKEYVETTIEYVEEKIDFKFNRPLFTREDGIRKIDNSYIKEIKGFQEIIMKSIKSKYSKLDIEEIFNNRLIIIDDIKDYWDNSHLIICNPYEYIPIPYLDYSFLNLLRTNVNIINYIKNSNNSLLPNYLVSSTSYDDFFLNYHIYTSELINKHLKTNNEAIKDEFYKNLLNDLKPRLKFKKPFTTKFIENLNKKMIK
jgi:hypothetical protein